MTRWRRSPEITSRRMTTTRRRRSAAALALVKKDEIKKAIELFTKMTKHKNEMRGRWARRSSTRLESSGHGRVQAALQLMESQGGEEAKAKKELKKVADEYPPLPCAKEAAEVLRLMAEKGR